VRNLKYLVLHIWKSAYSKLFSVTNLGEFDASIFKTKSTMFYCICAMLFFDQSIIFIM